MNFGRNLTLPEVEISKSAPFKKSEVKDPKFWLERMRRLGAYQDLIKRFLFKALSRQAEGYNKGKREVEFKVGDLVMRRDHHLSDAGKLLPSWLKRSRAPANVVDAPTKAGKRC